VPPCYHLHQPLLRYTAAARHHRRPIACQWGY
jgi:hypothetical protein